MTVLQLIKEFFNGYQDCKVTVWVNGERYFVDSVDLSLANDGIVELNVKGQS